LEKKKDRRGIAGSMKNAKWQFKIKTQDIKDDK
jgi:hypothetical protein